MEQNQRRAASPIYVRMRLDAQLNTYSSAWTFNVDGAFSPQFYAAASTLISSHFNFLRVLFINSFTQFIALIIPVLATLLQLKYQGNDQNKNPFATHPITMHVAVSSSVVYYIAYIVLLRFPLRRFAVVAHHCLIWSGHASVASLAYLLFLDSISPSVCAIFALLPASELLYCLYHKLVTEEDGAVFHVQRRGVRRFLNSVFRVVGNSSGQRSRILPIRNRVVFHVQRRRVPRFLNNVFGVVANSSGQRPHIPPIRNRVVSDIN